MLWHLRQEGFCSSHLTRRILYHCRLHELSDAEGYEREGAERWHNEKPYLHVTQPVLTFCPLVSIEMQEEALYKIKTNN